MTWIVDGRGLSEETMRYVDASVPVHLRLTDTETGACRGACDRGLGELWSGDATQVTCEGCKEFVHA